MEYCGQTNSTGGLLQTVPLHCLPIDCLRNPVAPNPREIGKFLRWAMVGGSEFAKEQTDEELQESLAGLAQCLRLLREYLYLHGMPERGGPRDQELVLREIVRDLYSGGTPIWALESVMQKAAEGLTVRC